VKSNSAKRATTQDEQHKRSNMKSNMRGGMLKEQCEIKN
jgi:hypothetical protein